jgi:hypothetical protein
MESSTIGKELCMSIASLPPVCGLENVRELQVLVKRYGHGVTRLLKY